MTADGGMTTVVSETTVVENDSNAVRSTITIGRVQSARTPTSLSETSAIAARPHDRVAANVAVDEIAPTVVDETITVVSETTVVDETITVDSETTVVDETTGAATDNNVERSPITIGPAPSVTTPISPSETSAIAARPHDRVVEEADDGTTVASAQAAINKGITTVAEAAMVVGNVDTLNKAVAVLVHNLAGLRMFNLAGPEENAQAMRTTNHRVISGPLLGSSSAKMMTERTWINECRIALPQCAGSP